MYLFNCEKYDLTIVKKWLVKDLSLTKAVQEIYYSVKRTGGGTAETDIGELIYADPDSYGLTSNDIAKIILNGKEYFVIRKTPANDDKTWNTEQRMVIRNLYSSLNNYQEMESGSAQDSWTEALYTVTELAKKNSITEYKEEPVLRGWLSFFYGTGYGYFVPNYG